MDLCLLRAPRVHDTAQVCYSNLSKKLQIFTQCWYTDGSTSLTHLRQILRIFINAMMVLPQCFMCSYICDLSNLLNDHKQIIWHVLEDYQSWFSLNFVECIALTWLTYSSDGSFEYISIKSVMFLPSSSLSTKRKTLQFYGTTYVSYITVSYVSALLKVTVY